MTQDRELSKFYAYLSAPLVFRARFLVGLLALVLAASFAFPLWRIQVSEAGHPDLSLDVYAHAIESGHGGADLRDLNTLHHHVGMAPISPRDLAELDWMPFAIGLLVILTLRAAAIGDVRALLDVVVLTLYAGAFSIVRFWFHLKSFGTHLDPDAPVKIEPFTPALFGSQTIGDVTTHAGPGSGALLLGAFAVGVSVVLVFHLVRGRRALEKTA